MRKIIEALQILEKYSKWEEYPLDIRSTQSGIIRLWIKVDPIIVSLEDKYRLEELGIYQ